LGNYERALQSLRRSTELLLQRDLTSTELRDLANNYLTAADIYRAQGRHQLAILYAQRSLSLAADAPDVNRAAQASSFLAVELARTQQPELAERQLISSMDFLGNVNRGQRIYTEPLVLTRAGAAVAESGDAGRAADFYNKALIAAGNADQNVILKIDALAGRAKALAHSDPSQAHTDLREAVTIVDDYRTNITKVQDRSYFMDARQIIFDEMISLEANEFGHLEEAYDLSERAHARTLLDLIALERRAGNLDPLGARAQQSVSTQSPLTLSRIKSELPDNSTLLQYSANERSIFLFVIANSKIRMFTLPKPAPDIHRLIREFVAALSEHRNIGEIERRAKELYAVLLKPAEAVLSENVKLFIVPDKALHFLPFGALIDESGRYLIDYRQISYSPSASVLVHCLKESARKPEGKGERVLTVGNPEFDRNRFRNLAPLQDADLEAKEIRDLYDSGSLMLNGADATESRIKTAVTNSEVVHFSSHCLVEERSPWLAALVLAKERTAAAHNPDSLNEFRIPADDGLLYLNEIYDLRLPVTRLVVLSACQSGLGQYHRGEGIVSLVRPFITLGVPTIVATLWPVASSASARLMTEFHRIRKQHGLGASESLRLAQLEVRKRGTDSHPSYWAPFIVVGAGS
jgi:CHAT domain-containing protein